MIIYKKILFNLRNFELGEDGTIFIISQNVAYILTSLLALIVIIFNFYILKKFPNQKLALHIIVIIVAGFIFISGLVLLFSIIII